MIKGVQDTDNFQNRMEQLIQFLDEISEKDENIFVSSGDVYGYIVGYFDDDSKPEDEIETLNNK